VANAELLRWAVAAGLALAAQGSGALPPPLPQIGADCERPTYASDRLVCEDAALLALDRQVRDAWLALAAAQPAIERPPLLESQQAWFGRRSRCAFVETQAACLRAAYLDRAEVLDAWQRTASGALVSPGTRMRCTHAPWGEEAVTVHSTAANALVITTLSGRMLAIASPGAGQDGWLSYVWLEAAERQLRLRLLSGAAITCGPG
jgi:uncharacterized protein